MEKRLATARKELGLLGEYNYLVINRTGELENAVEKVAQIIMGAECDECKTESHTDFVKNFYGEN